MSNKRTAEEERAAIVSWLLMPVTAKGWFSVYGYNPWHWLFFLPVKVLQHNLVVIAQAIQRGDHIKGGKAMSQVNAEEISAILGSGYVVKQIGECVVLTHPDAVRNGKELAVLSTMTGLDSDATQEQIAASMKKEFERVCPGLAQ